MNEEEKMLLLKDLCGRIPYKVIVQWTKPKCGIEHIDKWDCKQVDYVVRGFEGLSVITENFYITQTYKEGRVSQHIKKFICECKPYLRPKASMTDEEKDTYRSLQADAWVGGGWVAFDTYSSIDYLNSIHVDFRGMIDKDLAIAVTPENNPYNRYE